MATDTDPLILDLTGKAFYAYRTGEWPHPHYTTDGVEAVTVGVGAENLFRAGGRVPRPFAQACGALRPQVRDPGWSCTGRNLISVGTLAISAYTEGTYQSTSWVPIVLPARALDGLPEQPWWKIRPFDGGDHLHLVPPPPPTRKAPDEGPPVRRRP